jgi:thiol-disulfide isomerase/thioredoxin
MYNNIANIVNSYLVNYKNDFVKTANDKIGIFIILIIILIFLALTIFLYNNVVKGMLNKKHPLNREFINESHSDDVLILYFYTQWCPYCKQSLPEIKKFEDYISGLNSENSYKITLTKIDCDENTTMAEKYKIQGYPTIKLIYKGTVYDYDAKPNKQNLIEFLQTSIK